VKGGRILGTGACLPGPPIDNDAVALRSQGSFDAEFIRESTGIERRHWAAPGQGAAELAVEAARAALQAAGLSATALRRVLLGSSHHGDRPIPATANLVQHAIGATCGAVDVSNGCTTALSALDIALGWIARGEGPVLVVCADHSLPRMDPRDRRSFPLFGDGAAAFVLDAAPTGGALATELRNRGELWQAVWIPGLRDGEPRPAEQVRFDVPGARFIPVADALLAEVVRPCLARAGLSIGDLDRVILHQPNPRMAVHLARVLGARDDQLDLFCQETGNIPGVLVPLGIHRAFTGARPVQPGERWLLCAVGAGASAGAMVWEVA
jgi:3-oxoacyl-[acyl-carrier-protein] synthase-3